MQILEKYLLGNLNMQRVLFLCTGNSARSQMAEALLKHLGGIEFEVHSAGTKPKSEVNSFALEVLKEKGISIEGLYPKNVSRFVNDEIDIVVTVCERAKQSCPHFPGAKYIDHWSLDDPAAFQGTYNEMLDKFRETRDEIERRIRARILKL